MADTKNAFKYVRDNDSSPNGLDDESDGCVFEGLFELPNDGCPDSDRFLRIKVITHMDDLSEVQLDIMMPSANSETYIGSFQTKNDKGLEDLLYPVAKTVTKTYLTAK